jgi:hypothetical protein
LLLKMQRLGCEQGFDECLEMLGTEYISVARSRRCTRRRSDARA